MLCVKTRVETIISHKFTHPHLAVGNGLHEQVKGELVRRLLQCAGLAGDLGGENRMGGEGGEESVM